MEGLTGRIKDFEILKPPDSKQWIIITGSSDGAIRLWAVDKASLLSKPVNGEISKSDASRSTNGEPAGTKEASGQLPKKKQIGRLLGAYETGNRITCLKAFIMTERGQSHTNGFTNGTKLDEIDGLDTESHSGRLG